MADREKIHIRISRVIPAPKWKIVRRLIQVWEMPAYVPSIKEVSVLSKHANVIRTKWRVETNGVPIQWVEEDEFAFDRNTIRFRAVEGDLECFEGEWSFKDVPEGTEVAATAYLKVGIPAIEEFADAYIRRQLEKNFAEILSSLEQRLISLKYAGHKSGRETKVAGFGVLGHFYNMKHLLKCLKMIKPDFKEPSAEFLSKLFQVTPSFKIHDMKEFRSPSGAETHGCFIVCTFIPDMVYKDVHGVYSKVVRACKVAEKSGVGIVALGGLTSMVGERLGREIKEDVDVPITTGNTYTAALAVEGVERAARLLEKDLKDLTLAVIGGTGDIGSACARALCKKVKRVIITGRTRANIKAVTGELKRSWRARAAATSNNRAAVKNADIVIAAASASAAILDMSWFKPGAIICDLGYPKNISYAPRERKDLFVFSGGLASVPMPVDLGFDVGLPSPEVTYGCFSEAIILALERRFENFSCGRGNITLEKIDEIRRLAAIHGFGLAPFFWADGLITSEDVSQIKKAAGHV